jgi:hypothetical protein
MRRGCAALDNHLRAISICFVPLIAPKPPWRSRFLWEKAIRQYLSLLDYQCSLVVIAAPC